MTFSFSPESIALLPGLRVFEEAFPQRFSAGGAMVVFEPDRERRGFSLFRQGEGFRVQFSRPADAFRALGLLLGQNSRPETLSQDCAFETVGVLWDLSRNAVLRPEAMEALFRNFALMGINSVQLYMEDVYVLPGEDFFGYGRGAYSPEELRRIDDYGHTLGIEVVPCIQSLGHLEQILQWPAYRNLIDVDGVLLAGEEGTYALIGKMLDTLASCFRTRRIHIGMDEAHGVGTGRYLAKNGLKRPFEILNDHLKKVTALCGERGLKPMIWSDMYFRIGSTTNDYYDKDSVIPGDVVAQISPDVELVYWDYYHADPAFYEEWIRRHRGMGKEPAFAAGAWSWGRLWAYWPRWHESVSAGLKAARAQNLREVVLTAWGDDGAECHPFSLLPAIQYFAEWAYVGDPDTSALERQFAVFSPGTTLADCRLASDIDLVPAAGKSPEGDANFSKWILWHDPVLSFLNAHILPDLPKHYRSLAKRLKDLGGETANPIRFPALVARVLASKSELHLETRKAYESSDREKMLRLMEEVLPETLQGVAELQEAHRSVWRTWYKPFGWEVLDRRYGGLIARLESLRVLLQAWVVDPSIRIEEFEFDLHAVHPEDHPEHFYFSYARTATPSAVK